MMNLGVFIPEQLIQANIEVQAAHPKKKDFRAADLVEETRELLGRLNQSPADMKEAVAYTLDDKETAMLAGYLPYNYLQLDMRPYFEILRYRLDDASAAILFSQWQESFDNPDCNQFIKTLVVSNPYFQNILKKNHLNVSKFLHVLDSRNIPLSFDEELVGSKYIDGEKFNERLKYLGVIEQSFLDAECKRALLAFCSRTDYFSCSQENIVEIIQSYDWETLRKFAFNFMNKLNLSELQVYPKVAQYLRSVIGHRRSETFRTFFEGAGQDQVQQYIDWINLYKINSYFENDERSRFWKQYRYLNVIRYPVSNTVILEFDSYVGVEFLGEEKGTIYICAKDVFKQQFYHGVETMNNNDLRLFFKLHKDQCIEYRNHTGRWQSHISNVIAKKEMAEKIRI